MLSCALLALQSDGVVGPATCVARGAAVPAIERSKQIAGAHTAAIRTLPLPPQSPGVWSMEPLAAMAADFRPSLNSEAVSLTTGSSVLHSCVLLGGRNATNAAFLFTESVTTHSLAAGVRALLLRIDELRPYHMPVWRV
jgi:hypothetical protein